VIWNFKQPLVLISFLVLWSKNLGQCVPGIQGTKTRLWWFTFELASPLLVSRTSLECLFDVMN
jgi:hypothetical protein